MLTLYHYPSSPCAAKVRAVLSEKGLAWDSRVVDIIEKENLTPDYLRLHPKGLVPTLVDDGKVVIDSTIIMEYLDTAYGTDSLKPVGAYAQAKMRKWPKWVDETLHPNWPGLAWLILIRPRWLKKSAAEIEALLARLIDPARRARQRRMLAQGFDAPEFMASMRTLDQSLADMDKVLADHDWLAGDRVSLADCAMLPYVAAAELFGLEMMIAARPRVALWLARFKARSSYAVTMPWDLDAGMRAEVRGHAEPAWRAIRDAA
jgi:glutathione S-transferase